MENSIKFLNSFNGRVWAISAAKLGEINLVIESLLDGKRLEFLEAARGPSGSRGADPPYEMMPGGVALIPVYGTLGKRMNMFTNFSGGTSYDLLGQQLQKALADPQVKAILLDIDSPGGTVDGVKTLADQIYQGRQQKPIMAHSDGQMASAAYWLGSAADPVMASDTALVGSIGVAGTHFDRSGADAQKGVKRTIITSGKYKRLANDAEPLSPEGQDYLQQMSDTYYQIFLDSVAKQRGLNAATVHAQMGDGRDFIGKQARAAGLVDRIGTRDEALTLARTLAQGGKKPSGQRMAGVVPASWEAGVAQLVASGQTRTAAICHMVHHFPALHDDYLKRMNPGRG